MFRIVNKGSESEKIHFKFYEIFLCGRRVGQSYADWTSHGQGRKNAQLFEEKTTLKVIPELCTEQTNRRYSIADAK